MKTALLLSISLAAVLSGCNQSPSVLEYEIYGDAVTITRCDKNASGEIVIPDIIKNKPVTSIGKVGFFPRTTLTSITIPDNVNSIRDRAFYSCSSLESITILDSVTSTRERLFTHCYVLDSITIPNHVTPIGDYGLYNR